MPNSVSSNRSDIFEDVRGKLAKFTNKEVLPETELYYELGIYGEDLFELFEYLIDRYEVDFSSINASKIAPGEGGGLIGLIACKLGFRPYKNFTVNDLVEYTAARIA